LAGSRLIRSTQVVCVVARQGDRMDRPLHLETGGAHGLRLALIGRSVVLPLVGGVGTSSPTLSGPNVASPATLRLSRPNFLFRGVFLKLALSYAPALAIWGAIPWAED